MLLIYFALRSIIPKAHNSLSSTLRSALYVTTSMTINILLFSILLEYFDKDRLHGFFLLDPTASCHGSRPTLRVRIAELVHPAALQPALFIGNVFYYWLHRAQHAVPLLWRFHRVHHSITEMSAVSSYHHFTDDLLQYFAVGVPTAAAAPERSTAVPSSLVVRRGRHLPPLHPFLDEREHRSAAIRLRRPSIFTASITRWEARHFDKNFPDLHAALGTSLFGAARVTEEGRSGRP